MIPRSVLVSAEAVVVAPSVAGAIDRAHMIAPDCRAVVVGLRAVPWFLDRRTVRGRRFGWGLAWEVRVRLLPRRTP